MQRYQFSQAELSTFERLRQPFAIYQFLDKRVVTLALSDGFCKLFGYEDRAKAYDDMDHDMYKDTHPDDVARIANAAFRFATEGGKYEVIYRTKKKDAPGYTVVHAMGEHVFTADGVRLAQVWYTDEGSYLDESGSNLNRTITNALHEESILKESRYDYLTGLPNMAFFFELAEAGKSAILEKGSQPALLYIDLGGMKYYNHKNSYAAGDKLLRDFAKLLSKTFHNENCCHVGADHFAVFTEEEGLANTLHGLFREWHEMNGADTLPVRVGIYPDRIENVPVSSAYDRAKIACDALKGAYTSAFNYFRSELSEDVVKKQYIITNIDKAIAEGWIKVYYQPIVRAINGKVCDVEALARWIDPVKGFMSPADFIPYLEQSGLIYKLDLYVLEQVLAKLQYYASIHIPVAPHSINLSRSDFDSCDIVEEFRKRVDDAGVPHSLITVEITESVIGSDFEFMKAQVQRFQQMGFPVWMDDFGSGYSSLDVLQSIQFDLLKFDMSFLKRLDEGEKAKIILTELMKMANSMGVETVCEGVETLKQVRFLQEIGCSKLQGYFYSKPVPFEEVQKRRSNGHPLLPENPEEASYFEAIGRVNLFDLTLIANENDTAFQNYFTTFPIGILEMNGDEAQYIRINQAYVNFIKRFFDADITKGKVNFGESPVGYGMTFIRTVKQCCSGGTNRAFFDEKMPDGSVVHSFARKVGTNPVTGAIAVAIIVLSVTEPNESMTYAEIARALAADYYNLYVVDLDTDEYIEYSSRVGEEELAVERRGKDFFESSRSEANRIYAEDREVFFAAFSKENIIRALDQQGVFNATYRLMDTGVPVYASMKVMRLPGGKRIIMGISIVDAQMKQQEHLEELQRGRDTLVRVMALSDGYLSLFTVDPVSGHYIEYSSTDAYESLGFAKEGEDFFDQARIDIKQCIFPDDLTAFMACFSKENILREIHDHGNYRTQYRLMINGEVKPVVLKIAPFKDGEKEKLVVGVREWKERQRAK